MQEGIRENSKHRKSSEQDTPKRMHGYGELIVLVVSRHGYPCYADADGWKDVEGARVARWGNSLFCIYPFQDSVREPASYGLAFQPESIRREILLRLVVCGNR